MIESIHIFFRFSSLAFGLVVSLRPKGTPIYRVMGLLYVASIVGLNIMAFSIYRLFDGFGVFHVFAIVSLATIIVGLVKVKRRKSSNWLVEHFENMSWSYVGLLAATNNEIFVHIYSFNEVGQNYPLFVLLLTFVVIAVSGLDIYKKRVALVCKYGLRAA